MLTSKQILKKTNIQNMCWTEEVNAKLEVKITQAFEVVYNIAKEHMLIS